jgi:DegV family protein with EDD domain
VLERARTAREAMRLWFCLDTLEYLQRGGRIGRAAAWIGGALQIKPILSVRSEITPVERVRTAGRGFERMVDYMRELRESGSDAWVVQHVRAPERAAALADRGRELFRSEPVWVSEIGPVIGTYTGPGLLGVGGLPASLLAGL